ncbi:hypothetical protein BCR37DRAFT_407914 [Protomyces lactucae-debilis]|uniref:Uncharacterized protein n=1 Tax=Protomyces lactucae-debilis TaxID=2754530 RepID=A0A1Y2FLY4_PROLT|nr:uncharacterized protein BCR37DRAFT_407914 [Protomyces lactucae-debilis]ORY84983.1 hypothetical protein BCR37DRAFT_407914 [Protomyces lactucae-debilis]
MADFPRLLRTLLLDFLTRLLFTLSNPGSWSTFSSAAATTVIQNIITELLMPLQCPSSLSLTLLIVLHISLVQLSLQITQMLSAFRVSIPGSANETNDLNPSWPGISLSFEDPTLWNNLIAAFGQEQVLALPHNHLTRRHCYSATFPYIVFKPLNNAENTGIAATQESCRAFCENEMMQYSMQLSAELRQPVASDRSKCFQDQSFAFEVQESIHHHAGASCAISAAENRGQCPYAPSTCACRVVVRLK